MKRQRYSGMIIVLILSVALAPFPLAKMSRELTAFQMLLCGNMTDGCVFYI